MSYTNILYVRYLIEDDATSKGFILEYYQTQTGDIWTSSGQNLSSGFPT